MVAQVHPDCINASNPYHECTDYCFKKIADRKSLPGGASLSEKEVLASLPKEFGRKQQVRKRIETTAAEAEAEEEPAEEENAGPPPNVFARPVEEFQGRERRERRPPGAEGSNTGLKEDERGEGVSGREAEGVREREEGPSERGEGPSDREEEERGEGDDQEGTTGAPSYENMSERQKKLFDLRMKMNQARQANQGAMVAERKREQKAEEGGVPETRGMSKAKWYEEKQKKLGKALEANGLDMSRAYMLDTQEAAEGKYKKWDKKDPTFGWDVFNQKTLYTAYKKRTENVTVDMDEYERQKQSDPDFYRDSSCMEYGKAPDIPEENVDRMVAELQERGTKRKEFSRRRRYHEEKDIDSINDRNEHFNRKIERAFGKYTVEIKNNLERGTALPD